MKKFILFVKANLRRSKTQTISTFVLVLLASMLLNIWLMLSFDYKQNFWRCHDRLNAEHVVMIFDNSQEEFYSFLEKTVKEEKDTAQYYMDKTFWLSGTVDYNGGVLSSNFFILEKDTASKRPIGKYEIIEDSSIKSGI